MELVVTHLACADEPDHPLNYQQLEAFERLRRKLPSARVSIGNSAGTLNGAAQRGDVARPGIGLYGGNPFTERPNPFEPVVTLNAPIVQIRDIDEVQTVGYGATFGGRAARAARGRRRSVMPTAILARSAIEAS